MPKVPSVHYYREAFNVYQKYRRLLRTGGEGLKRVRGRTGIDVIMNNKSRISSISKRSIILKKKKKISPEEARNRPSGENARE